MAHPVDIHSRKVQRANDELNRRTYGIRGALIGGGLGAALGTYAGRKHPDGKLIGGLTGLAVGSTTGALLGREVRRKKPVSERAPFSKHFSTPMNKITQSRLVQLNARLDDHLEFSRPRTRREEEEATHYGRNAALAGGVLAAGAGGVYYRGHRARMAAPAPESGTRPVLSVKDTFKLGGSALKGDAIRGYNAADAGVRSGWAGLRSKASTMADKSTEVYNKVAEGTRQAAKQTRKKAADLVDRARGKAAKTPKIYRDAARVPTSRLLRDAARKMGR